MKLLEFEKTSEIKDFTKRCLMNESIYDYKGSIEIIKDYWTSSKDVEEFTKKVLEDKRLENNQGYWQLVAEQDGRLADNMTVDYLNRIATNMFTTMSDVGSLSVGTDNFKYNIPNGVGDGNNVVFIFDTNIHLECLEFETTLNGKFNIYDYDCGGSVAMTLEGRYALYKGKQLFAFVKWE